MPESHKINIQVPLKRERLTKKENRARGCQEQGSYGC